MRAAVTYDIASGEVFQHFGRTEYFKFYDIENGKITDSKVASTNGQGHGALAWLLQGVGADTLICGGIGGGAQSALSQAGITLYGGVTGSADEAVNRLIAGTPAVTITTRTGRAAAGIITTMMRAAAVTTDIRIIVNNKRREIFAPFIYVILYSALKLLTSGLPREGSQAGSCRLRLGLPLPLR